jgi:phage terminase small subunit
VKERIAELTEHSLREIGVTRERVLLEMSRIAFVDPADAYDEIGQLLPIREMPENVRRSVSKIKIFEHKDGQGEHADIYGFTKDVEFAQKKGALDSLAKHLGMSPDKFEHSGPDGKPIETRDVSDIPDDQLDAKINAMILRSVGKE